MWTCAKLCRSGVMKQRSIWHSNTSHASYRLSLVDTWAFHFQKKIPKLCSSGFVVDALVLLTSWLIWKKRNQRAGCSIGSLQCQSSYFVKELGRNDANGYSSRESAPAVVNHASTTQNLWLELCRTNVACIIFFFSISGPDRIVWIENIVRSHFLLFLLIKHVPCHVCEKSIYEKTSHPKSVVFMNDCTFVNLLANYFICL
jgi:hypothetical protein